MINKALEKREVDEDSDSDYVDVEEDFDPHINKGFCKSIFPPDCENFRHKAKKNSFYIKHQKENNKNNHLTSPNQPYNITHHDIKTEKTNCFVD